ncbi:hypothetical protein SNE25_16570 [Mucilaginibacter sabulilitoris]|uniref:DUF1440 domain-containing protein n=1 Tax=Mucilaginibacter sabulilitoris TaxID=1173583 RepID=A0ABZ0TH80_9SPHI|nr:hypothetical protein [Mucilaginibacter sabulilitoris]WPU90935.1 hypothetical protein SNE25_16570 [Mucilaginibacter sabulilitoris]
MEQRIQIDPKPKSNGLQPIILAGLTAGLLDGIAASIVFNIKLGLNPGQVMQYVASGLYGRSAFSGGISTILIGTLLHFLTAITIAAGYFYAYTKIKTLRSFAVLSGLTLGLCAWLIMNLVVVPLSKTPPPPFGASDVAIGIILHMFLVGLPISLIIKRHSYKTS